MKRGVILLCQKWEERKFLHLQLFAEKMRKKINLDIGSKHNSYIEVFHWQALNNKKDKKFIIKDCWTEENLLVPTLLVDKHSREFSSHFKTSIDKSKPQIGSWMNW